ncbi:uncharacterized protein LOC116622167 [Phoca vitulina]|uniref:uncharacterized protein LOC116622167 n=1 Tax=Phoca vitulina TaxID=9720 RepID=UPI001395E256|nr:uncharacterized protein LOC116622167 [Phoca vitulina]
MLSPFARLIALLGTCPKETAGSLGRGIVQRRGDQTRMEGSRSWPRAGPATNRGDRRAGSNRAVSMCRGLVDGSKQDPPPSVRRSSNTRAPRVSRVRGIPGDSFPFLLFPASPNFPSWRKSFQKWEFRSGRRPLDAYKGVRCRAIWKIKNRVRRSPKTQERDAGIYKWGVATWAISPPFVESASGRMCSELEKHSGSVSETCSTGQGRHTTLTSAHESGDACAEKGAGGCAREGGSRWILPPSIAFLHLLRFRPCCSGQGDPGWARLTPLTSGGGGWRRRPPQPDSGRGAGSGRRTPPETGGAEDPPGSRPGPGVLAPSGPGGGLRGFCAVVLGVAPEGPARSPPLQPPGLLSAPHPRSNPLPG